MLYMVMNFVIVSIAVGSMFQSIGAADKVVHLMEYKSEINITGGEKIDAEINGNITLNNVKFCYPSKPEV
jgi:ABC-type bacteriocin/lantibiotic exporter with double-glycine peptidase domain